MQDERDDVHGQLGESDDVQGTPPPPPDAPAADAPIAPFTFDPNPARWIINDELRELVVVEKHPSQNIHTGFDASEHTYGDGGKYRYCHKSLFEKKMKNLETVNRSNLLHAPSSGNIYCYPCMLFATVASRFTHGFNDWKHATHCINAHERSASHREALMSMANFGNAPRRPDNQLTIEELQERDYWTLVLKRVVSTVKFLSERGLALQGRYQSLGSVHNGNFIGII